MKNFKSIISLAFIALVVFAACEPPPPSSGEGSSELASGLQDSEADEPGEAAPTAVPATLKPKSTSRPTVARPTATPVLSSMRLAVIAVGSANLRSGPGTNYDVVTTALEGETFGIFAKTSNGEWFAIATEKHGSVWVAASVVEVLGDVAQVEIAVTIPAAPQQPVATLPPAESASTLPPPTEPPAAVCDCSYDRYNCGDFSSGSAALACFNYCYEQVGYDVHDLDRDGDGRMCER